jgi:small-conductance mechanosensitive channel
MNKSISFSFLADGTLSNNDEDDTSNKGSNRQPISSAPPIKPLTSYVSEPASNMQVLRGYAVAELQAINNSTSSTSAAASAPTRTSSSTLNHAMWAPTPSSMHIYDHPLAGELAISTASKPSVDNIFLSHSPRRAPPPQLPPLLNTSSTGGSGPGGEIRQRRTQQGGNVVLGPNPATAPSTTNYNRRSVEGFSVHSGHGHDNASITSCDDNNNGKNKKGGGGDGGSQMGDIDWEDEDYAYDVCGKKKQFWMKKKFWKYVVPPLIFSSIFIVIGVIFLTEASANSVSDLEIWRMCFFLAGLPFVWWFGTLCTATFVWVVERSMFTWKGALYFAYAVRKPLANVIRAAVALGWWALMLTVDNNTMNSSAKDAYTIILKLWACVTLFMTANLLKRLLAKILASKFHKTSHMENMMKSLRRERWLHMLLWPRDKLFHDGDDDGSGGSGGAMMMMNDGKDGVELEKQGRGASMPIALDEKQSRRKLGSALLRKSISMFRTNGRGSGGGGGPNQHGNNISSRLQAISEEDADEVCVDVELRAKRMTTTGKGGLPTMAFEDGTYFDDDTDIEGQEAVDIEAPVIRRRTSDNSTTSIHGGAPPPVSSSPSAGVVHTRSATLPARHLTVAINTAGTNHGGSDPSSDMNGHGYRSPAYSGGNRSPRLGPFAGGGMNSPPMMQSPTISPKKRGGLQPSTGSGHMPPASPLKRQISTASGQQDPTSPSVAGTVRGKGGLNKKHPSVLNISGKLDAQKLAKMEKYIRKSTLTLTFRDELNRTQKSKASVTVVEAKKMAFYLWVNVRANPESSCITVDDLRDFLPEDNEAEEAHAMLDADNDGTVTFKDCCNALMAIIEERANLAATLKDAKSVVSTLETLIGVIIHTVFLFIYLIIFEVNVMETYLGLSSLVLAFSFVFGNSIRTMFENVIFLFVVHPFDIGDTIFFEDNYHKVEEINLHFTCFNRADNARVWYPNQKLVQNSFINLNYSGNRGEPITILIDIDTPASALEKIEKALKHVVDENPKEFGGYPSVGLRQATDPLKVTLYIWFEFSHNGIDLGRCRQARTKVHLAVFDVINKLGIKYTWPEQRQSEMSKLGALPGGGGREELRETFTKDDSGSAGAAVLAAQQMLMQQNTTMDN